MVRAGLCRHLGFGRDVLEKTIPQAMLRQTRSIYCGGTPHHDLLDLNILTLRVEFGLHGDRLCEYNIAIGFQDLGVDNVEKQVRSPQVSVRNRLHPRLRSSTIHLNRFGLCCGLSIGHYVDPE